MLLNIDALVYNRVINSNPDKLGYFHATEILIDFPSKIFVLKIECKNPPKEFQLKRKRKSTINHIK